MKNLSFILAAGVLLILPTGTTSFAADDDVHLTGSVGVGGQVSDGTDEGAKSTEYRDLDSAIYGDFLLDYYKDHSYLRAEGTRMGLDDQSYELSGGMYQKYKLSLYYDGLPHNLSYGARSYFSGMGSGNLYIDTASPANQATWTEFTYDIDTTNYGAKIEFSLAEPYFLTIGVNRQEKDGVKPLSSGSFSGSVEMPEPVDNATNNFTVNGGYRAGTISFNVEGLYSSFSNDHNYLSWENPFSGATEHNSLSQDSDFGKIGADFTWRQLPYMSTLVLKGSYTNLSSDAYADQVGGSLPAGLSNNSFDGDISTVRLSAAYLSHPMDKLDTKLYYNYYDRNNDSTIVDYSGGSNEEHLFDYNKYDLGVEAGYKLTSDTKLSGGYNFQNVDRHNRPDASSNSDNKLFVEVKNNSLENMTIKAGYTYLNRDTDTDFDLTGLTPADAAYISQFVSRYDTASKSMNKLKLELDIYPVENIDFGLSYSYVNNDYDDVVLGRTDDTGHEVYGDVLWRVSKLLNLNGFIGYEHYDADSNNYNHRAGFQFQSANPTIDDGNPASFVWSQSLDTDFWTFGLMAEMPLMQDRLKLSLSFQYQNSDGKSDISAANETFVPIDKFEDYYITTVEAKGVYALTDMMDLTVGYIYEKSTYEDLQYLGYEYDPSGTLLSGAYSDHDYDVNVGYVTVSYNF